MGHERRGRNLDVIGKANYQSQECAWKTVGLSPNMPLDDFDTRLAESADTLRVILVSEKLTVNDHILLKFANPELLDELTNPEGYPAHPLSRPRTIDVPTNAIPSSLRRS